MNNEILASNLLDLASEQRLEILKHLREKPKSLSELKNILDRSASETHRNLQRLYDSQLIVKDTDGKYSLSSLGFAIAFQLESIAFVSSHKEFWRTHSVSNLPDDFVRRLGDLTESELVSGFVKVQEMWQNIYQNSDEFIYNMLLEASYNTEIISLIQDKLNGGVIQHALFSKDCVFSEKRKLVKSKFSQMLKSQNLERRVSESFSAVVFLNEKEGCVCFSDVLGKVDLSCAFYGKTSSFRKWCLDFFESNWVESSRFSEKKLDNLL